MSKAVKGTVSAATSQVMTIVVVKAPLLQVTNLALDAPTSIGVLPLFKVSVAV